MAKNYHLQAIDACKQRFRDALKQLADTGEKQMTVDDAVVDQFAKGFEEDFLYALTDPRAQSETFPENAWAITRQQVFLKVHAIAALSSSYALEANRKAITTDDLRSAVLAVKPQCKTTTAPLKTAAPPADPAVDAVTAQRRGKRRLDYCGGWGV